MKHTRLLSASMLLVCHGAVQAQTNWVRATTTPLEAVPGGHDANGNPVYVCRTTINGQGPFAGWSPAVSDGCHVANTDTQKEVVAGLFSSDFLVSDWVRLTGAIPLNAAKAGPDANGVMQYYCRATYSGVWVGKLKAGASQCVVPYVNGQSRKVMPLTGSVDILMRDPLNLTETHGLPLTLVQAAAGAVPPDALAAGKDGFGKTAYICSVSYNGTQPGLLRKGEGCYITYNDQVLLFPSYAVLVPTWDSSTNFSVLPPEKDFFVGLDKNQKPLNVCRAVDGLGGVRAGSIPTNGTACQFGLGTMARYATVYDLLTDVGILIIGQPIIPSPN